MSRLKSIRIGSRSSPLAMIQAEMVRAAMIAAHGLNPDAVSIVPVVASGDRIHDRPLAEVGGKALWTKELDQWLLSGDIDCAVHSMKDVETIRPDEIVISAMLLRADVRDVLIGAEALESLASGARVGTSSPRRAAQLRHLRPDLDITLFRGNVATRLAKLERGEAEATLLAKAGLDRLGQGDLGVPLAIDVMLPAPSQGAIGIECRSDNVGLCDVIASISDAATIDAVSIERGLLARLGADCHSPVAALAEPDGAGFHLRAQLLSEDGSQSVRHEARLIATDYAALDDFASKLLNAAPDPVRRLFAA